MNNVGVGSVPVSVFPTVTIALKGFLKRRPLISDIWPKPFGSLIRFRFIMSPFVKITSPLMKEVNYMAKKRRFYQWRCTWCHNDFLIPPDNDMLNHIFINCGGLVECPWCFSYTRLNPKDLKEVKKKIKYGFINFEGSE